MGCPQTLFFLSRTGSVSVQSPPVSTMYSSNGCSLPSRSWIPLVNIFSSSERKRQKWENSAVSRPPPFSTFSYLSSSHLPLHYLTPFPSRSTFTFFQEFHVLSDHPTHSFFSLGVFTFFFFLVCFGHHRPDLTSNNEPPQQQPPLF